MAIGQLAGGRPLIYTEHCAVFITHQWLRCDIMFHRAFL